MTPIWVFDRSETLVTVLSNDNPGACPFWDDVHDEQLNGVLTYEFTVPADHSDAAYLVRDNYVAIRDMDGNLVLFQIKITDEQRDTNDGTLTKTVHAENAALEILGTIVRPQTLNAVTAEQALQTVLSDTRWDVGMVDWLQTQDVVFDQYITAMAAVQQIQQTFGGDLQYRVELQNGRIVGRYIDLLEHRGSNNGKTFTYGKDLQGVTRTEDSTQLYTALIGLGKSDDNGKQLTFSDVEWSVATGDPVDKPKGQDWVGDPAALEQWGYASGTFHRFGLYTDEDEEDAGTLLEKTWAALQQSNAPRLTYDIDVVLLERLAGYEHERVRLGDEVLVKDMTFQPYLAVYARVIELQRSYTDPTKDKATLGEFQPTFLGIDATVEALQAKLAQKSGYWDAKQSAIAQGSAPPGDPTTQPLWIDTSQTPNVLNVYNSDSGQWVKATPTQASEVGAIGMGNPLPTSMLDGEIDVVTNKIKSGANMYWDDGGLVLIDPNIPNNRVRLSAGGVGASTDGGKTFRTAMTGAGIVADLITTGEMSADRIKGGTLTLGGSGNGNGIAKILTAAGYNVLTIDQSGIYGTSPDGLIRISINPNDDNREAFKAEYKGPVDGKWYSSFAVSASNEGGLLQKYIRNLIAEGIVQLNGMQFQSGTFSVTLSGNGSGSAAQYTTTTVTLPQAFPVALDFVLVTWRSNLTGYLTQFEAYPVSGSANQFRFTACTQYNGSFTPSFNYLAIGH
ncbi:phage tail spike protein [Alicyclobacillus kakegawensis]|uniref:phage tail spike protein n=1 Tax=Alicyclobacillus kakegawensis TaxID=392012 RepID=UPI0008358C31|nr:phage tail spike protein [Alicyclobacillus kakegawensis]